MLQFQYNNKDNVIVIVYICMVDGGFGILHWGGSGTPLQGGGVGTLLLFAFLPAGAYKHSYLVCYWL